MEIGAPQYDNSKRALQALQRSDLFEAHDVAPRAQIVGYATPNNPHQRCGLFVAKKKGASKRIRYL